MALNSIRTSIIAATVALTALTSGVAHAGTTTGTTTKAPAAPTAATTEVKPTVLPPKFELTKEQQQKIQAIRADRLKKIDAVLTADQRAKLDAAKDDQGLKTALGTLNLSKDQKTKITDIVKKSNDDIKKTLTQKQLQQLEQLTATTMKK